jgi:eukaryotic-like serine/threonine-protein kinase
MPQVGQALTCGRAEVAKARVSAWYDQPGRMAAGHRNPDTLVDVPVRDPLVGSVINGKFHILRSIARGGMGRIYYATQAPLDRPVALKVVRADVGNQDQANFLARFLQEASILAKLQHPNVVTLFDYGRIESGPSGGEQYFIAMEYLAGETLSARLKQRQLLSTPEVLFLMRQIGRGLREAHTRGVVHRDLKPSNILLVPEADGGELVKIVDFGIGKVVSAEDVTKDLTQDGMMVGTPRYMAPEQFEGTASTASDVYALGTIAYQSLAGTLPFHGNTLPEFMVAKFAHAVPRIREVNPQAYLPEALDVLVLRMLARVPEERPSLDELFAELALCEQEVFGHAQSAPSSISRAGRRVPTGSGAIAAVPREPSRVPPTVVAAIPTLGSATSGQLTPRPMSTSMQPPVSRSGGRAALLSALAVGLLAMGVVGVWAVKKSGIASISAAPASATVVEPTAVPPPTAEASFVFSLESTPPGATVLEGDRELGPTPIEIPIARASVQGGPRTFVIKKDGFTSETVHQGWTDAGSAQARVRLATEPPSPPKVKPHHVGGKSTGGKPPGAEDIRLTR